MREKLQQYNFSIEYKKGSEHPEADTLSRIYGNTSETPTYNLPRNVLVDSNGNWYYKVNEKETKLFPPVEDRQNILKSAHETTTHHGGMEAMLYEIKRNYFWSKLNESITQFLKKCIFCQCNRQKSDGGAILANTKNP
ncbi:Pro-Pol polyprotein [Nosema granulosis]|uniref:Pro-Pol polyprotein n=1 Tax=Nosema granulosis TaxID=83296 RepID=A0A9P6H0Q0_9MICR|nr:Pro-Pol polyprotein [Nosema granulosis]